MSSPSESIIEKLYPMAVANYVAKLPEMQPLGQHQINQEILDGQGDLHERIDSVAGMAGVGTVSQEIHTEVEILMLTISDREDAVQDQERSDYYKKSDVTQTTHRTTRLNLGWFMNNGLAVRAQEGSADVERLRDSQMQTEVPLIETFKASRILNVNGFENSRAMHLIHDLVDHPVLFNMLRTSSIFERYADFLDSIDFTEETFLYSRQAELVASVGFGSRRWELVKARGDSPLLAPSDIIEVLETSGDERCHRAARAFEDSAPLREQAQFVIENMVVQIADERRRYGSVKMKDASGSMAPMPLLEPLYLAFLIDSVRALQNSSTYETTQVQAICMVEEVLKEIRQGKVDDTIYLRPSRIGTSFSTEVIPETVDWIAAHKARLTTYK